MITRWTIIADWEQASLNWSSHGLSLMTTRQCAPISIDHIAVSPMISPIVLTIGIKARRSYFYPNAWSCRRHGFTQTQFALLSQTIVIRCMVSLNAKHEEQGSAQFG